MKLLEKLRRQLKKTVDKLKKKDRENRSNFSSLHTLAPKVLDSDEDIKRIQPYLDSLKVAIEDGCANNIAITGRYGSGKSTVLRTFQKEHKEYSYLNISLASFVDDVSYYTEVENGTNNNTLLEQKIALERRLETSILQQLFYQVKPSLIPSSRFKRIVNYSKQKMIGLTLGFLLWLICAVVLFKYDYVEKMNPEKWDFSTSYQWIALFSTGIFLAGVGVFSKNIYMFFINSKISKLTIKGEIELGEENDKSVFNIYLEEILYFFERTNYNVVILEDIDRFNSTDIFTKLREVNTLINKSRTIDRPVKFVYAIKDDMFTNKSERVKFFEFIIPIVPFISPSNANEQLEKLIESSGIQDLLSKDFLSDVVTFIDDIDMRLLKNIFNEYQIYRKVLHSSLKQDNLFAILVYKNLYPDDFALLSKREGKLYSILNNKKVYIRDVRLNIDEELKLLDKEIVIASEMLAGSIEELRYIYLCKVSRQLNGFYCFWVEGKGKVMLHDAISDVNFNKIKSMNGIDYVRITQDGYGRPSEKNETNQAANFSKVEKEISSYSYNEREDSLNMQKDKKIEMLKSKILELKRRIEELDNMSIKDFFEIVDVSSYINDFKDNLLMRNLLLNGYIDENYDDYITLFHEINLTRSDFVFEWNIKVGVISAFDYTLYKTDNLIKGLPEKYFGRAPILNFYILDTLLVNEEKYASRLEKFYKLLTSEDEKIIQFVIGFIQSFPQHHALFVKNVCRYKKELWSEIHVKSNLPDVPIRDLLKLIFEYADYEDILKLQNLDSLISYISKIEDFFHFASSFSSSDNLTKIIADKNICFRFMDKPASDKIALFNFIYQKNHYVINEHNVNVVIEMIKPECNKIILYEAHYTTILNLGLSHLKDYINSNINEYVANVLLPLKTNRSESEQSVIELLNRDELELQTKREILLSQDVLISSFDEIDGTDVMSLCLEERKIIPSWENVINYCSYTEPEETDEEIMFDESLVNFLNDESIYSVLSKNKMSANVEVKEEYLKKICVRLIYSQSLNPEAYSLLLTSLPYIYNSIGFDKLNESQTKSLLDRNKVSVTKSNLNALREIDPKYFIRLVENRQEDFIENFNDLDVKTDDWKQVFKSSVFQYSNKVELIKNFDKNFITGNQEIAKYVFWLIPLDRTVTLDYEVVEAILNAGDSLERKIKILNVYFDTLAASQIKTLVEKLGENYARMFIKQNKPVFELTDEVMILIRKLEERKMIKRYELQSQNTVKVLANYN